VDANPPRDLENLGVPDGLVQLSMLVQSVFARAAGTHNLSVLQARLLGVLRDREPTMAELRRLLDLDKSSTTGLVDRAERRSLVRRIEVPEDGRSFRVRLTPEGSEVAEKVVAEVSGQLNALADHLSNTNRHRLALLATSLVVHNAEEHGIDLSVDTIDRKRAGMPPSTKGSTR
jgi:DNA-binding MarR family transcriptional regulator